MTIPTFQQLYDAFKAEVQSRRSDLTDWNEGSVLDALAGGSAMLGDESMRFALGLFAELFFDTAKEAALDRLALDRLGLVRKAATAAYGTVTWTRGTAGAYTVPAGTVIRATVGGESFTVASVYDVALAAGDTNKDLLVQATSAGRSSNLAATTLTEVVSFPAEDASATVTNAEALAGGSDAETDSVFRDRIRRYYSTLRRGTVAALETGALSVPGVAFVSVDESDIETTGIVRVYVGDPDARSNSTLAGLVDAELENWRAAGVMVTVSGASRDEVALTLAVDVERGADQVGLATAIRAAVVGYGDTLAPNRTARLSRIQKAVHDAGGAILSASVTSHTADIEPATAAQAVRFVSESIALTFTEVAA